MRLPAWRKIQQLPIPIQTALRMASYGAVFACSSNLVSNDVNVSWLGGLAAIALYERFRGDPRVRPLVREARRTGVSSGYQLVDAAALGQLPEPRIAKSRRASPFVAGVLIVIVLPVAAAIVRTPWWLLTVPVLALPLVWDANVPERARHLREAMSAEQARHPMLVSGDGSPPRPARPAV